MLIVKFKSWKSRWEFYKAHPKAVENRRKKPGQKPFRVSLDLTKHRYDILKSAKGIIRDSSKISYAFTT